MVNGGVVGNQRQCLYLGMCAKLMKERTKRRIPAFFRTHPIKTAVFRHVCPKCRATLALSQRREGKRAAPACSTRESHKGWWKNDFHTRTSLPHPHDCEVRQFQWQFPVLVEVIFCFACLAEKPSSHSARIMAWRLISKPFSFLNCAIGTLTLQTPSPQPKSRGDLLKYSGRRRINFSLRTLGRPGEYSLYSLGRPLF